MPIYEFYCRDCNTIFNFFSRTVNTTKTPVCPRCRKRDLERQVSLFAAVGKAKEDSGGDLPFDESKMEKALTSLAAEAEGINEENPKQAAQLMRKFSGMTGIKLGQGMEEALGRLEAGEDPDKIEAEMGDLMEKEEEPFSLPEKGGPGSSGVQQRKAPVRDNTLYEL